jgi:TP901 family phage tail tape measure protein
LATKSKIQIEIETILSKEKNSVENALSKIKSELSKLEKVKVPIFSGLKPQIQAAQDALKPFVSMFEKVASMKVKNANAFSQVFSQADIARLKEAYKLVGDIQAKISSTTVTGSRGVMGKGISGYLEGVKELLGFQARWYAARAALFTAVELPINAVKTNLELGKAVKQAGAAADLTTSQMEQLRQKSVAISNEVPIASDKIAQSAFVFAQSGMDFKTITEAMPLAAKMVVTTGEDMKVAVDALTVAFFGWKLQAKDLPKTADMITAAMAASRMEVKDLGTVFNYLATTAKTLNVSLDSLTSLKDTLTMASVLSQAGVKPSTIGTGLSNAITKLVKATKDENSKLYKILQEDKIDVSKIDPTKNRLVDIFKELSKSKELTLAEVFTGWEMRAGRSISAILNQGVSAIDEMEKRIEAPGVLERMFKTSTSNVLDQLKILENKFTNIFQITGNQEKSFVAIIKALQTFIDLIIKFRVELFLALGLFSGMKVITTIDGLIGGFSKLIEKIFIATKATEGLKLALRSLGLMTVVIGIIFSITYILKNIAEKVMTDETGKLGELVKTFTTSEISSLKKMAQKSQTDWLNMKGFGGEKSERDIMAKLERGGAGRLSQDRILKLLAENDKKVITPEVKQQPEIDRSGGGGGGGGGGTKTKGLPKSLEKGAYRNLKEELHQQLEQINLHYKDVDETIDSSHNRNLSSDKEYYNLLIETAKNKGQEKLAVLYAEQTKWEKLKATLDQDVSRTKDTEAKKQKIEAYRLHGEAINTEIIKTNSETYKLVTDAEDKLTKELAKQWYEREQIKEKIEKDSVDTARELQDIEIDLKTERTKLLEDRGFITQEQWYATERVRIQENTKLQLLRIEEDLQIGLKNIDAKYKSKMVQGTDYFPSYLTEEDAAKMVLEKAELRNASEGKSSVTTSKGISDIAKSTNDAVRNVKNVSAAFDELRKSYGDFNKWGYDTVLGIANGIRDGVTSIFSDIRHNELKSFEDYFLSFADKIMTIWDNLVGEMIVKWLFGIENMKGNSGGNSNNMMGGILGTVINGVIGMFGGSTGSIGGSEVGASIVSLATGRHQGGVVGVKKFHSGGLNSDERMVINKVGERYITQEQNAWLNSIAQSTAKGSGETQPVYNINISAVDSKSFVDMLNKDPNAIVKIVDTSLRKNEGFRQTVKRTTR